MYLYFEDQIDPKEPSEEREIEMPTSLMSATKLLQMSIEKDLYEPLRVAGDKVIESLERLQDYFETYGLPQILLLMKVFITIVNISSTKCHYPFVDGGSA